MPRGIRARLYLLLAVALIPVLLLQGLISFNRYYSRRAEALQTELEVANGVATTFAGYLQDLRRQEYSLGNALADLQPYSVAQGNHLLLQARDEYYTVRNFFWLNPRGRVISSSAAFAVGSNYGDRPYVQEIIAGRDWVVTDLYRIGLVVNDVTFFMATAIYDERGVLQGIMLAGIDPTKFGQGLFTVSRPERGGYAIFDRRGTLVYRNPETPYTWEQRVQWKDTDTVLQQVLQTRRPQIGITELEVIGELWVAARVPISDIDWVAGAVRPENEVLAPVWQEIIRDALLFLVVAMLAFMLAFYVGRTIVGPLRRMDEDAGKMVEGRPIARDDPEAPAEVAHLRETMTAMADELRQRVVEVQRRLTELDIIFNGIVDSMIAYDAEGVVIKANPAMVKTVGRDPTGMSEAEVSKLLTMRRPDGRLMHEMEIPARRALRGEPVTGERMLVTDVDGHEMILLVTASPLLQDGEPWGVVSIWHDISKRERLFEEVQRRTAELDASLDAIADGLIIYNTAGEIQRINPVADEMLGFTIEECHESIQERWASHCASNTDGSLLAPDEIPAIQALQGKSVRGKVLIFSLRNGTQLWVSVSAGPIYLPDGALIGVVGTYTDITELHNLQEQQKVLLHMVSHDLRAPLAAIKGQAELLLEDLRDEKIDGEKLISAESILRSSRRMNMMIQDLVDAARLEGKQLELNIHPVEVAPYVAELLSRTAGVFAVDRIRVDIPPDLPPARADSDRLERVFVNLISNALKFSPEDKPVIISARAKGEEIVVSVQDFGVGIKREDISQLFQRYYRAQTTHGVEGVGLGLYITKQLVEAHGLPIEDGTAKLGGRIWVESEEGEGSTFFFTLPVYKE